MLQCDACVKAKQDKEAPLLRAETSLMRGFTRGCDD